MTFLSNPFFLDFILFFTTKILLTLLFRKQKNNIMKEKEGVEMDKRQLLIEEYLELANEIIHRNKPEMEKEFAGRSKCGWKKKSERARSSTVILF